MADPKVASPIVRSEEAPQKEISGQKSGEAVREGDASHGKGGVEGPVPSVSSPADTSSAKQATAQDRKSKEEKVFPGRIKTLVIRLDEAKFRIRGIEKELSSVRVLSPEKAGVPTIRKSKTGRELLIFQSPSQKGATALDIAVPVGTDIKVDGGTIEAVLYGPASDVSFRAGMLTLRSGPKSTVKNLRGEAGVADIVAQKVQGEVLVSYGAGSSVIALDMAPYFEKKKGRGLSLTGPTRVLFRQGSGKAVLFLPKKATVTYAQKENVSSDFENEKRNPDVRVVFSSPTSSSVLSIKKIAKEEGEKEGGAKGESEKEEVAFP